MRRPLATIPNNGFQVRSSWVDVEKFLDPDTIERLERPTAESTALPNLTYTSADWLALENERLFARTWMLAGLAHDIPEAGDAWPVTIAEMPLLLVRERDGEIAAFHNVCRHRGARLVTDPCKGARAFTCAYHGWTYEIDGRLKARPHFHGGEKHDILRNGSGPGLVPVRAETWHDWVFVNIAGNAAPLMDHLAPLTDKLDGYDFGALRFARTLPFDIKGNWKLVHENFFDPYHVFKVHPALDNFAPMASRRGADCDGPVIWSDSTFPEPEEGRGAGLPYYPGLPDRLVDKDSFFHFFPTTLLQVYPNQLGIFQLFPLAPERTIEHIHLYFVGDAATAPEHEKARAEVYATWDELNTEDFTIIERLQQGRCSAGFDGGMLSDFWDRSTQHFARLVVEGMR